MNLDASRELLRSHYGASDAFDLGSAWRTSVAIVLHGRRTAPQTSDWAWLGDTVLASPAETAHSTAAVLGRLLESHGQRPKKGKTLLRLAQWWNRRSDAERLPLGLDLEAKVALCETTGLSVELVDALLLVAGKQLAFPVSRGTMRIVCRHGWLDAETSYEDWQAWLCRGAADAADLAQLWRWLVRVAHDYCGTTPKCETCPLQSVLPANGPVPLDEPP